MFTMTGAVTGGPQVGYTTPVFNMVLDNRPDVRSTQSAITSLGGTMTGVTTHTINAAFTCTVRRPSVWKNLGMALLNGVTAQYSKVPYNEQVIIVRKAAQVALGQWWTNEWRLACKIYAGSETYDAPNVRAGASFLAGFLWQNSSGFGQSLVDGIQA
jgi:hypothetical protein